MSMTKNTEQKNITTERPPIIAVMGHIDHGKSALLDFIRKSNIVAGEAGGITQHISAYEVVHKTSEEKEKKITFLDTPGHAAFTAMRARGANIADIAILIVSAEEGPKPQTLEAYKTIKESSIPFVVAINKIDKLEANVEKVKTQFIENEIYLEGYGGDIPYVAISAKTGQGIPELLDTLLLISEMEDLKGDPTKNAEGFVLETNLDKQKGVCATLIINNGSLKIGDFVVSGNKCAVVKTINDFLGKPLKNATFSNPVEIIGFKEVPAVGSVFKSFKTKKEAEVAASSCVNDDCANRFNLTNDSGEKFMIPLVIKADVLGTIEAIQHEIEKIKNERVLVKIIYTGVGNITENDIKTSGGNENTLVVGFNVKIDRSAQDIADKNNIQIGVFNIIYKLTEWLEEEITKRTPKVKSDKIIGKAKIIRVFSRTKDKQVVGGQVLEGSLSVKAKIKISRRDFEIGKGIILGLQSQKIEINEIKEGEQFGAMVEAKKEIAPGDIIEAFVVIEE